jgi:hypothetical protein
VDYPRPRSVAGFVEKTSLQEWDESSLGHTALCLSLYRSAVLTNHLGEDWGDDCYRCI